MIRNEKLLRATAIFLLFNLLMDVFLPGLSFALTSGPTAPEATTFEPVDGTDMINMLTGDLAYSTPLMEVPGPEGSYPLALSYHSGILPEEDASWVGLGWSLNPGAITRQVSGYADDHTSSRINSAVYTDVGGGKAIIADAAGVSNSMGLTFHSMNTNTLAGPNSTIPRLVFFLQGTETSFSHQDVVDEMNRSNEEYRKAFQMIYGDIPTSDGKAFADRTQLINWKFPPTISKAAFVPLPDDPNLNVYLKNNYFRYYYKNLNYVDVTGTLMADKAPAPGGSDNTIAFDSYALIDPTVDANSYNYDKPNEQVGGSFPAYDSYSVSAQGLSGSISPYIFENGSLFRQNADDNATPYTNDLKYKRPKLFTKKVNFRFNGDFSNALDIVPEQMSFTNNINSPVQVNSHVVTSPSQGYNSTTQQLAGSRHIEWFTREEINNGTAKNKGLILYQNIDNQMVYGQRQVKKMDFSALSGHIAAFMITNESGITYHYALPVYSYDEFSLTGTTSLINTNKVEQSNKDPYAYQWLLTAVTGTDYVDRNNNGLVDESDWGYWVSFGYGKWTDKYAWRTPDIGYVTDIDADNSTYSFGRKELYYLDFIKTRTHTALFVKDIRTDGKGVSTIGGDYVSVNEDGNIYTSSGLTCTEKYPYCPVSVLKLNEIMLLKNDDLNTYLQSNSWASIIDLKKAGTALNQTNFHVNVCTGGATQDNYMNVHFGRNVFDINDLTSTQYQNLKKLTLKSSVLNTDYTLCDGTPNSIEASTAATTNAYMSSFSSASVPRKGKLTLRSLKTLGVGGADMMPATNFNYELPTPKTYSNMVITFIPGQLVDGAHLGRIDLGPGNHPFVEGDIIKFTINSKLFYAALIKGIPYYNSYNNLFNVVFLGSNIPVNGDKSINATIYETKTPGYRRNATDIWGMFKSDYDPSITNMNMAKAVTDLSSKSLDVWSLREVETPMGAKLTFNYESDKYKTPAVYNNFNYNINTVSVVSSSQVTISLLNSPLNMSSVFPIGSNCDLMMLQQTYISAGRTPTAVYFPIQGNGIVTQVTSNTVTLNSTDLVSRIQEPHCCVPPPNYKCRGVDCAGLTYSVSIIGGNVKGLRPINIYGGGIRVSSVKVSGSGLTSEINYNYDGSNGLTSGVTTYEPLYSDPAILNFPSSLPGVSANDLAEQIYKGRNAYRNMFLKNFNNIFLNARETPAPGVMYEYITIKEKGNNVPKHTYTKYQFEVYDPSMVQYISTYYNSGTNNFSGNTYPTENRMVKIKNYTARIGALKACYKYDSNTNRLLTRITNKYLHDGKDDATFESDLTNLYANQGMVKQSFNEFKIANRNNYLASTSTREEYPLVNISTESQDYIKGAKKTTYIKAYDFYSGAVTKSWTSDSYYNFALTETVPAYKKYPEMGLKVNTYTNRHILSPSTATYTYKTDIYGNITGTLAASVNTWSKECNYRANNNATSLMEDDVATVQNEQIWRARSTYVWHSPMLNTDGTYQNFVNFDWSLEAAAQPQHKFWQKNSEITLYDRFSNALEVKDVNGNYISTKMGYNNSKVLANAVNAKYTEMAYTGAEDPLAGSSTYYEGEVTGQPYRNAAYAHTGKYSIKLNQNQGVDLYSTTHISYDVGGPAILRQKKYRASVWVHKDNIAQAELSYRIMNTTQTAFISGNSVTGNVSLPKCGDWYLLTMDIDTGNPVQTGFILLIKLAQIGGNNNPVYFDDFRFHPVESTMSTYVYDLKTHLVTHILDNENFYTRFEYDPFGRLIAAYKETINGEKKTNDYYYNYGRKP